MEGGKMRALVTGGAGFIGSNLVDLLIENGHQVSIIDNLSSGKLQNINPKAKFYQADICDPKISEIFIKIKPEIVFHLAAQIDVRKSIADPIYNAKINTLGLLNILENCRQSQVKKVIFSSSGGVIYNTKYIPANEDDPKDPLSPYGITKYDGELYLNFYHKIYNLNYTALRYSNVYGPRQDPLGEAGVVAIFTNLMLEGKQPTIFGDGKQTRDYVYVGDVARANLLAMEKGNNDSFNIGTGHETDVNELFAKLKSTCGFHGKAKYAQARPGELLRNAVNPDKAAEILDWKPEKTLAEGLKITIDFIKKFQQKTQK